MGSRPDPNDPSKRFWTAKDWRGQELVIHAGIGQRPRTGHFYALEMQKLGRMPRQEEIWFKIRMLHHQLTRGDLMGSEEYREGYLAAVESLLSWIETVSRDKMQPLENALVDSLIGESNAQV